MSLSRRDTLRLLLATATLAPFSAWAQEKSARRSPKKGWAGNRPESAKQFGCTWWYAWGGSGKGTEGYEFVPMAKGNRQPVGSSELSQVSDSTAKCLLGFNEPERTSQGNLTVAQAIEAWPLLVKFAEEKKLRLGSPSVSSDGGGGAWMREFMEQAQRKKLRIDFVTAHWYRSADAGAVEDWLKELNANYKRPVWVTEFNGMYSSADEAGQVQFLKGALRALERQRFVERYAYFNPSSGKAALLKDSELTRLGEVYRSAGD